jgi:Domain of unknown function (DUF1707)/Cell wall-active antibiotics response 4TMS YvqF
MTDPPEPEAILASDAERDQSVTRLRDAVVEGRLTLEEFSERVGRAQTARTGGELVALTTDLPQVDTRPAAAPPARHRAILSSLVRRGAWEMPARSTWRSVCGTIHLDLREARLGGPETELEIFNVFGTVTVLIPAGIAVEVDGGGMFASQVIEPPPWLPPHGAPRLKIRIAGPGGTTNIRCATQRPELTEPADHVDT